MRIASTLVLILITEGIVMPQAPLQGERDRAMSYLHSTRKQFLDVVTPLSASQWSYKPAGGGWSIAEVAEHLAVTEGATYAAIEKALRAR